MLLEDKAGMPVRILVIGTIRTPFVEASGTPIQAEHGKGVEGRILVDELYVPALDDIDGFERLWLIYWMDRVGPFRTRVIPYRDTVETNFGDRRLNGALSVYFSISRGCDRKTFLFIEADSIGIIIRRKQPHAYTS